MGVPSRALPALQWFCLSLSLLVLSALADCDIVMVGGFSNANDVDAFRYDTKSSSWDVLPSIVEQRSRYGIALAAVDEHLYAFGGSESNADTDEFSVLNNMTWRTMARSGSTPSARRHATLMPLSTPSIDGGAVGLYLFGGAVNNNGRRDVHRFDVARESWSPVPVSSESELSGLNRESHCASRYHSSDEMIIFGGKDESVYRNDVWILSITTSTWRKMATTNPPSKGIPHGCAFEHINPRQGRLWVVGVTTNSLQYSNAVSYLDSVSGQWFHVFENGWAGSTWGSLPHGDDFGRDAPDPRRGALSVQIPDGVILFGGSTRPVTFGGSFTIINDMFHWSFTNQSWTNLTDYGDPNLPAPRHSPAGVSIVGNFSRCLPFRDCAVPSELQRTCPNVLGHNMTCELTCPLGFGPTDPAVSCIDGILLRGACEDVDECLSNTTCPPGAACSNSNGSFSCSSVFIKEEGLPSDLVLTPNSAPAPASSTLPRPAQDLRDLDTGGGDTLTFTLVVTLSRDNITKATTLPLENVTAVIMAAGSTVAVWNQQNFIRCDTPDTLVSAPLLQTAIAGGHVGTAGATGWGLQFVELRLSCQLDAGYGGANLHLALWALGGPEPVFLDQLDSPTHLLAHREPLLTPRSLSLIAPFTAPNTVGSVCPPAPSHCDISSMTRKGDVLRVSGEGLHPNMVVKVGGLTCDVDVTRCDSTQLVFTVPPWTAGQLSRLSVRVESIDANFSDTYSYLEGAFLDRLSGCSSALSPTCDGAPSVGGPVCCDTRGGDILTLYGAHFRDGGIDPTVLVDERECTSLNASDSGTKLTCQMPAGVGFFRSVDVFLGGTGARSRRLEISYARPELVSLSAGAGPMCMPEEAGCCTNTTDIELGECPRAGLFQLTIKGRYFGPSPLVFVGGKLCRDLQEVGPNHISCEMPAGRGLLRAVVLFQFGGEQSQTGAMVSYKTCNPGTIESLDGPTCKACAPGTYASASGTFECLECQPGSFASDPGAANCSFCPPGSFSNGTRAEDCFACPPGSSNFVSGQDGCHACVLGRFAAKAGQAECEECFPGRASGQAGSVDCALCVPGTYTTASGAKLCIPCKQSEQWINESSVCLPCPLFSTSSGNASASCLCDAGFFAVDATHLASLSDTQRKGRRDLQSEADSLGFCVLCPPGADCTQRGSTAVGLLPLPEWSTGHTARGSPRLEFFRCRVPGVCTSVPNFDSSLLAGAAYQVEEASCSLGYSHRSALCSVCGPGFARAGSFKCNRCPPTAVNALRLIFVFVLLALGISFLVLLTLKSSAEAMSTNAVIFKIWVSGLQFNALATSFDFQWPQAVQDFISAQNAVANVGASVLSFDCLLTDDPAFPPVFLKALLFALLPPFCLLLAALLAVLCSARCRRFGVKTTKDVLVAATVILLFLFHPSLTQQTFQLFHCARIGPLAGDMYLAADLRIRCHQGMHTVVVVGLAMPMMLLYVLGIPILGMWLLFRNREAVKGEAAPDSVSRTHAKYSFMYKGYKNKFYWWGILVMLRKVALVAIAVFGAQNVHLQALLASLLLVISLLLQMRFQPFAKVGGYESPMEEAEHAVPVGVEASESQTDEEARGGLLNMVELMSLLTSFALFFGGQFLFVEGTNTGLRIFVSCVICGTTISWTLFALGLVIYSKVDMALLLFLAVATRCSCCQRNLGKWQSTHQRMKARRTIQRSRAVDHSRPTSELHSDRDLSTSATANLNTTQMTSL